MRVSVVSARLWLLVVAVSVCAPSVAIGGAMTCETARTAFNASEVEKSNMVNGLVAWAAGIQTGAALAVEALNALTEGSPSSDSAVLNQCSSALGIAEQTVRHVVTFEPLTAKEFADRVVAACEHPENSSKSIMLVGIGVMNDLRRDSSGTKSPGP